MKHMKKKKDNEHDFYLVLIVTFYLGWLLGAIKKTRTYLQS